jgi:hypothetical protein
MSALTHPTRRHKSLFLGAVVVIALALQVLGANPAVSQGEALTAYSVFGDDDLLDPSVPVWDVADEIDVELTAQQVSYPFGGGSVPSVQVRALQSDGVLYMRVRWADETADTAGSAVDDYTDAMAVEFPSVVGSSVPALCMGQADSGVNIWQWRATNQDGLGDSANELFTDAQVDEYPSTDDLYFPARDLGNPVAVSGAGSTENLVAQGFGTLEDAQTGAVHGRGSWENEAWTVVVARDLVAEGDGQIEFQADTAIDTAIAVWNGDRHDRNGQKSVSQFVQLRLDDEIVEFNSGVPMSTVVPLTVAVAVLVALVIGFTLLLDKRQAAAGATETAETGEPPPNEVS